MAKKVRILHVINSFEFGGAEAMLCNLILRSDRDRFEPAVAALIDDMSVADPLVRAGIPIATMGMAPGIPDPRGVARLARHIQRTKPDLVQTWMDHSNLLGGIAAWLGSRAPVVWSIHHSNHAPGLSKRSTLLTVAACARLSRRLPTRIVFCSEHARKLYTERGFSSRRMTVIPNGFDTSAFRPDADARLSVRRELGIASDTVLVGLVARFDPLKDHQNFLQAAGLVARRFPKVRFLLCGDKVTLENAAIREQIESLALKEHCHLLGPRRDVPRIQSALDIAVSSSISEAFPLVVGEAMSTGVPCVVTDVGDSALIVGDYGRVVPSRDSNALAGGISEMIEIGTEARQQMGAMARQRVLNLFDLDAIARRYESLYDELTPERISRGEKIPSVPSLKPMPLAVG